MRLSRFFLTVVILTITFCVYIQLQIQIVDLAYEGKRKEIALAKLSDEYGHVSSNILKLKSANHLGVKLLTEDSTWKFAEEKQFIALDVPETYFASQQLAVVHEEPKSDFFSRIFSVRSLAEAEPTR